MKPGLIIVCLLLSVLGARAEIEFAGFFSTSKDARFSLFETTTKTSSGWLRLNDTFQGLTVVSFDVKREVIVVKEGEQTREIPLRAAKVKEGKATITGVIDVGMGQTIQGVRASLFVGEESAYPLNETTTFYLKPERLPDGNLVYRARFVTRNAAGRNDTITAPSVVALPGKPFSIQVGQMGYSFTP